MITAQPKFLESSDNPQVNRLIGLHLTINEESLEQFTEILQRALNTADPNDPKWKDWIELMDRIQYGMPLPRLRG